jgi:hypothetical protein
VTELIRRFGVGIKRFRRMFRSKFEAKFGQADA